MYVRGFGKINIRLFLLEEMASYSNDILELIEN